MIRYIYVILVNFVRIIYNCRLAEFMLKHPERYSIEDCYQLDLKVIRILKRTLHVNTLVYGRENLPQQGGYVMFPNHQGKYDALGIMYGHEKPCSVVMDYNRAQLPLVKQFVAMVDGKRLKKNDVAQARQVIHEMADEVRNGKKYIIFPSGGYENGKNEVMPFKPGSFKAAILAKAPIVPVAIIDSYKIFEENTIGRVTTQVHFLEPLYYEDYAEYKSVEIARMVEERIKQCIRENESAGK